MATVPLVISIATFVDVFYLQVVLAMMSEMIVA